MKSPAYNPQRSRWIGKLTLSAAFALLTATLGTTARAQLTSVAEGQPSQDLLSVIASDQTGNLKDVFCIDNSTEIINGVTVKFSCNVSSSWTVVDAGGTGLLPFSPLAGYSDPARPASLGGPFGHFFYVDNAHHLHQILTPNIPGLAPGDEPNTDLGVQSWGGISGYSSNGEFSLASTVFERVFYVTSDQHVQMLVSSNGSTGGTSWNPDLRFVGGPLARYGSDLTSFHDGSGEHVFYVGADQHVREVYGSWISYYICSPLTRVCGPVSYIEWSNQDLTQAANGPLVYSLGSGSLTSFSDATGEYVFYLGADAHIHELSNSGAGWGPDQDLTKTAISAVLPFTAGPATGLTSLSSVLARQLFYFGTDLNLHQIVLNSSGGADTNLTANAGGPMANPCFGLALTSFSRTLDSLNQFESDVFYPATDSTIHRMTQVDTKLTVHIGFTSMTLWEVGGWGDEQIPLAVMDRCIQ